MFPLSMNVCLKFFIVVICMEALLSLLGDLHFLFILVILNNFEIDKTKGKVVRASMTKTNYYPHFDLLTLASSAVLVSD